MNRKRRKLVFIIPRGEVIRNFAYTGILSQLLDEFEIHLISVVPNSSVKTYLQEIVDHFYEIVEPDLPYSHRYLLELLDLAHNKRLWSEASKVRWQMRSTEARGFTAKVKLKTNRILARLLASNSRLGWLEKRLFRSSAKLKETKHYRRLLNDIKPDLVFNGSHVHSRNAYPIIQAAKLNGIKTGTFLFSWDNLTSQGRIMPPYDTYLAWSEGIKQDLMKIYPEIVSDMVYVTGTPQFVFHFKPQYHISRDEMLNRLGLKPGDRYVLYSSGMSHHMPHEPEVAELVADILGQIDSDLRLVIRTYAKDKGEVFEDLKLRRKDILIPEVAWEKNYATPLQEDQVFFTNLLRHCEMGVNVASTVSLELCMLDKPAINIGFNPPGRDISPYDYTRFYSFDHYSPVVESGAVSVAGNPEELKTTIETYLSSPEHKSKNRKRVINDLFDGKLQNSVLDQFIKVFREITP